MSIEIVEGIQGSMIVIGTGFVVIALGFFAELIREWRLRRAAEREISRAYWRGRETGKRLERERHK